VTDTAKTPFTIHRRYLMVELSALLLPILLSAVFVFIVSAIIHTVLPWHKGEYPKLEQEDKFMDAVRPFAIPPGDYMVPRCNEQSEMKTPEFKAKMEKGPVMIMTVLPNGVIGMGKSLTLWFLYSVVVSLFAAYLAGAVLPSGASYLTVFRVTGTVAFAAYSLALMQMSIWYSRSWNTTTKSMIDGFVYALLTGGTFGWLWPAM